MKQNLLDQLAEMEVPPPPPSLRSNLHERLNHWLLIAQVTDLVIRGFSYATYHFALAVLGLIGFTITGKFKVDSPPEKKSS